MDIEDIVMAAIGAALVLILLALAGLVTAFAWQVAHLGVCASWIR